MRHSTPLVSPPPLQPFVYLWFPYCRVFTELRVSLTPGSGVPSSRLYYSSQTFFPVLMFESTSGQISFANKGPLVIVLCLGMCLLWAAAAAVFISPSYIGISLFVLIKVAVLQFLLHFTSKNEVRGGWRLLRPYLAQVHDCVGLGRWSWHRQ